VPPPPGCQTDQLREVHRSTLKTLEDPNLRKEIAERRAALRGIANEAFDFEEMAKRALARHWRERTPAEQKEFVQLFADLMERSYVSKIELYGGEKIRYAGESVEGEQATVRTKIVTKQGTEVLVDYRMHRRDDRWLVYDVVIEGIRPHRQLPIAIQCGHTDFDLSGSRDADEDESGFGRGGRERERDRAQALSCSLISSCSDNATVRRRRGAGSPCRAGWEPIAR